MKRVAEDFFECSGGHIHHESHVEDMVKEVNTLLAKIRSYDVVAGVEVIWKSDVERMAEEFERE